MSLTQDELVALVLTKLRTAGSGGSGSGEGGGSTAQPNAGMTEEELQKFNELLAKFAALQQVAFEQLNTNNLFADLVEAGQITVDNAFATYLAVLSAVVTNLNANKITADYINVENLEAVVTNIQEANIDTLFADYIKTNSLVTDGITASEILAACGKFFSLITNSLSAEDVTAFKISSDHVTFENASIKNAAIESVNAGKINAGTLNTSRVAIKSGDNTSMIISDGLIQIQDNQYVRVQIGRVATNTYDMRVWDMDGQLMWSASGITAAAIKEAIIVDDMIAEDANISASKINISSLVTAINEDGNVETKAANITIDAEGQKLSTWFSTMQEWKSAQSEATSTLQTSIETINGKLSTFVSQTDIQTITNDVETIRSTYSSMMQTVNGISSTVSEQTTQIQNMSDTLDGLSDKALVNDETFNSAVSEIQQTSENIRIAVYNAVMSQSNIENIGKWFKFTTEGLIIGSDDNFVRLKVSNDNIEFISHADGADTVLGKWDGETFISKNIVLEDTNYLRIGDFEFTTDDARNLVIRSYI